MSEELDLLNDNRPIRYVEIDASTGLETVVYRASAIGGCTRALIAAGSAYEPMSKPGWFQEVLDEGSRMESVISEMWDAKTDVPTVNQQFELELEIGEINGRRVIVRCHIDGMAESNDLILREFKKFRPSTWPKFLRQGVECNVNYPWQVAIAMYAGGYEHCEFVGGQYDPETDTVISVESKQITNPPIPLKAIKLKIAKVERCINEGQHPSQTSCVSPLTYPCGYYYLHDEPDDDDEIPAITDEAALSVVNRIVSTAVERAELNKRAKALGESEKYDLKLLKEILKVGDGDVGAGMAGKLKVEWGMSNGRKGYTVEDSPPAPFLKVHPLDKSKFGPKKEGK